MILSEKPPRKTKTPLCCTVGLNKNFLGRKILFISFARISASFVVKVLPALGSITLPFSNLSIVAKLALKARQGVAAIRDAAGSGAGSGAWKNARPFESKNLDEIVTEFQLVLNQKGEEEFTVTFTDHFFDGLKVQATRTDKGVVVKFICPNAQTRGTFVRYRPHVYSHFKAKNIAIFRIDVV